MKKRKVVRAVFNNLSDLGADQIAQSQDLKNILKQQIPIAIEDAIKSNKHYATIFEINSSNHYVEIAKKNWITALENCIMLYLSSGEEDFEECIKIKDLIKQIQQKKSTIIDVKKLQDAGKL